MKIQQQTRNGDWEMLSYDDPYYRIIGSENGKLVIELDHLDSKGEPAPFRIHLMASDINRFYQRACREGFLFGF